MKPEYGRRWPVGVLLGLVVSVQGDASPISWPEHQYNPQPLDDDVVLPAPCGGAMTFRKVETEAPLPLDDHQFDLGGDSIDNGYAEHRRPAYLAGGFALESPRDRHLLMGKYEVQRRQYLAVMTTADGADCPGATVRANIPQTEIGWHDATRFSHLYSLWLRKQAAALGGCRTGVAPCVPREDGEIGYIRLPTESEWEFAVRGGAKVTPSVFRDGRFPMPGGTERYAWFSDNARGKIRPIGLREPNPLGLHDMLGNAAEMVFEPFRLTRLNRDHGQTGGAVIRGGSLHSSRTEIRSSVRREMPFYDSLGAVKTPDIGFRVVVSVPILTSAVRLEKFRKDSNRLGNDPPISQRKKSHRPKLGKVPKADPIEELTELATSAGDDVMRQRLERLVGVFRSNRQDLYDQRDRAARETLRFGGIFCQKLGEDGRKLEASREFVATCTKGIGAHHPRCQRRASGIETVVEVMEQNVEVYADAIIRAARNFSAQVLGEQLAQLRSELSRRGVSRVAVYPQTFFEQVIAYQTNRPVPREQMPTDCMQKSTH